MIRSSFRALDFRTHVRTEVYARLPSQLLEERLLRFARLVTLLFRYYLAILF